MKKLLILGMAALTALVSQAADIDILDGQAKVKDLSIERSESLLIIDMYIDVTGLRLKSEREVTLTPVLKYDDMTQALPSVIIAGRNRYIRDRRHDVDKTTPLYRSGKTTVIPYHATIPYEEWMTTAELSIGEDLCGCAGTKLMTGADMLATLDYTPKVFAPEAVYVTPVAEAVKTREVHGSAYIDFPVNKTQIFPDYRRNPEELAKIRATIDVVKNDPDTRIVALNGKGYASPEGPYTLNEQLAKGRTETLARYVQNLYTFPADLMKTSWEAEDWAGLIKYVRESSIDDKEAILSVITNESLAPDAREWKLKSTYPEQYRFLLTQVYPSLRHSDYSGRYTVRTYTEVSEIIEVMHTAPQKLSLSELFLVAQTLEPGTPEYDEVFDIAVVLFPDDATANLNAGVNALRSDNIEKATRYLKKGGTSPEADYARGILAAKNADYTTAAELLTKARERGIKEAGDAMESLRDMKLIR